MSLETFTGKVSDLVATNPTPSDPRSQGDDHLRGIKMTIIGQSKRCQIGQDGTPGNNFTLFTPDTPNGTMKLARGNAGVTTQDIMVVDAAGGVSFPQGNQQSFKNILINGDMRINQRGVTIAAATNGTYGPDRWKKVDASNMTQIVEAGNFKPNKVYTLSGTGVTTQQLTSPASGNWTLPNIPIAATNIQLEEGSIATPFELRPIGLELSLCQRYYTKQKFYIGGIYNSIENTTWGANVQWPQNMRTTPTTTIEGGGSTAGSGLPTIDSASTTNARLVFTAGPVGSAQSSGVAVASAEL